MIAYIFYYELIIWPWGFPGGIAVNNPPAMQETQEMQVQALSWEEEIATYSCIPARKIPWKNPIDKGGWQATVHGVTTSQTQLSEWTHLSAHLTLNYVNQT